jgi:hypothetical protein
MQVLVGPVAALTVATLFYCYRHVADLQRERNHRLRERITYMLWCAATCPVEC